MDEKKVKKEIGIVIVYLIIVCGGLSLSGFHAYHIGLINEAQLGYLGAIIGGGITLLGVWVTIKNQEEQRREDLAIQYRPLICLKNQSNLIDVDKDLVICYENLGRGEAMNVKIQIIDDLNKSKFLNNRANKVKLSKNNHLAVVSRGVALLPANETNSFTVKNIDKEIENTKEINLLLLVTYTDLFYNFQGFTFVEFKLTKTNQQNLIKYNIHGNTIEFKKLLDKD